MNLKFSFILFSLFSTLLCTAQDKPETVYTTSDGPTKKHYFYEDISTFWQLSAAIPLTDKYHWEGGKTCLGLSPGLFAHGGYGIHIERCIGLSANTGINWSGDNGLVSVPVYASLLINFNLNDNDTSFFPFLEGGLGKVFTFSHINRSGKYELLRIGLINAHLSIFADISGSFYGNKDEDVTTAITLGIAVYNFM